MKDKAALFNPFPGLRSFRSDEDHLFFGREEQTLELMARLERNRFIAVVGTSGRGKSSLVRCGLLSRLQGGGITAAGAHWEIAVMHPGGDPLRHLAEALLDAGLYDRTEEDAVPQLLATLGRSQFGLVQAVRQAGLPAGTNFLLVVDQFEEIFRYDEAGATESERANDFLAMLREACAQTEIPIYVVATMRSDFIGDCSRFDGLAEAVNRGEYLVPRLSREQFKSAIEGPIRVAGGRIAPRLLQRLLNDVGEEQDQLPCLQHALMRTWRVWQQRADAEALDLEDYAQVGKMSQALLLHADEVWQSLATDRQRELCVAMFKALTVEGSEKRGIRRPRRLQTLCRILEVDKAELVPVIDAFRQPEVSFLMPPANVELRDATVIDLSHESLMRVWTRLREWVDEEARSVGIYRRLSESATLWRQGRTGLVRDPELSIARAWRETTRPNAAWAEQYEGNFDEAMAFLQASADAADAEIRAEEERVRVAAARQARRQRLIIAGLATAVAGLLVGAFFGIRAQRAATKQASAADLQLGSRLIDEGKISEGLAYLVRAARKDPTNDVIAPRLLTTIAAQNLALPIGQPLALPKPVLAGAYSPDGKFIGVQTEDDAVHIIDAANWSLLGDLSFGAKILRGGVVAARRNPNLIAFPLTDGTVAVVNGATRQSRFPPIKPPTPLGSRPFVRLSPDGRWLAARGENAIWLWETDRGELRATLPVPGPSRTFSFSPDNQRMVVPNGPEARIWSVPGGKLVGTPISLANGVYSIHYAETADRILVTRPGGTWEVYDGSTGERLAIASKAFVSWGEIEITADGKRVMASLSDNTLAVVDVATGEPAFPALPHGGLVNEFTECADGRLVATNCTDGLFRLWNMETGKLVALPSLRHTQYAPIAVAPDGRTVVVFAGNEAYRVQIGNGASRPLHLPRDSSDTSTTASFVHVASTSPARLLWFSSTQVRAIDFASGREAGGGFRFPYEIDRGRRGVAPSGYGMIYRPGDKLLVRLGGEQWRAWTLGDTGITRDVLLEEMPPRVRDFSFVPSANLAAAILNPDPHVHIWDLRTGRKVATIATPSRIDGGYTRFSSDGTRVAYRETEPTRIVHVCELPSGKELYTLQLSGRASISGVTFTPDGRQLLTGDTWGGVEVWDAATGRLLRTTQAHRSYVQRFDFSPDERYYSTSSYDGTVQVWATATHERIGTPLVQSGLVVRADFSPDNTRILTPSGAGVARVWDVRSALPLTPPMENAIPNGSVISFTHDGQYVFTLGGNGTGYGVVSLWPAPPQSHEPRIPEWLLRLATVSAGQRLTEEGKLVSAIDELPHFDEVRAEITAAPDSPYAAWAQWILDLRPERPIAPGFTITPAEAKSLYDEYQRAATPAPLPPKSP